MACSHVFVVLLLCPLFQSALTATPTKHAAHDLCGASSPFSGKQRTVACYAGFFLTKMLGELNSGSNKTAQHVRVHLLPYLGGDAALAALRTDSPNDAACVVCFSDAGTADGLGGLRASLPAAQREAYDALQPCYHRLTDRIMTRLPVDAAGVWLQGQAAKSAYEQTVSLLQRLFDSKYFDEASCRL